MLRTKAKFNFDELEYTEKACVNIKDFSSDLSGRERQLLLLMMRDSDICYKARNRLLEKVNVFSLLSRGYLTYENQAIFKQNNDPATDVDIDMKADKLFEADDADTYHVDIQASRDMSMMMASSVQDTTFVPHVAEQSPVFDAPIDPALQLLAGHA